MLGKLAMIAFVVFGLRVLAAGAPVSERTAPIDAPVVAARPSNRCECGPEHARGERLRGGTEADRIDGDEQPVISPANRERLKEIGSEAWTLAKPLLRLAAERALDGLASLLHTAAERLPRASGDGDVAPERGDTAN